MPSNEAVAEAAAQNTSSSTTVPAASAYAYLGLVYQIRGNASNSRESTKLLQHLHCRGRGVARLNSKEAGHSAVVG